MIKNKAGWDSSCLKKAFLATIPVMAGYTVLGIGFGMLLQTRGYGVLWALAMSVFIFAGSMQYVAVDLLTGGVSFVTAALTTLAVNARHLFYGISMVDKYKKQKKVGVIGKYFLFWTLTDETYSLTALFLTVFVEQWLTTKNHLAAVVGVVSSVLCLLLFGSDKFLIPAMILIAAALILLRKREGITNE